MRILVTGYKGFIGRNMLAWLNQEEGWLIDGWEWGQELPNIENYDWVIHLGATNSTDVDLVLEKNYEFSQWLFNECTKHGVNLQYSSTYEVYGHAKDFSETASCCPQNPSAWSKYLFDRWAFQQPITSFIQGFRYFKVYGKWQHISSIPNEIHVWREQARKEKRITIGANAENIKQDWVWVGDVCRLHIDFIKTVKGSGIWNVGSGLTHSLLDIAEEIAEIEQVPVEIQEIAVSYPIKADLKHLKDTIGKRKWLNVFEFLNQ
jgi:ADP-L-glycero-D-manno-heptose 6-epimerase